jgi:hypothetical protein
VSLPWVRLDANIATHDKVLDLLARPSGYRAFTLYVCALGWSGGQGTDGAIPKSALNINHGTEKLAWLLVDVGLWDHADAGGYTIRNWAFRQETQITLKVKSELRKAASRKGNCIRYHGRACGCWQLPPAEGTEDA